MTWWQKTWAWLKKWGSWLLGGIVTVLLGVLTLGWYVRRQNRQIGQLKDQVAVADAMKEITRLRALREGVAERVGEKDQAIEEVDRDLAANQRRIVEAHEGGKGLSDEEVAAEFVRLGF